MKDLYQILVCLAVVAIPFSIIGGSWWKLVDYWKQRTSVQVEYLREQPEE